MLEGRIEFQVANRISELRGLQQRLARFGRDTGLCQKTILETNLILEELLSNIITYGYTDDAEHLIRIALSHEKGILRMEIEDDGISFNPTRSSQPDTRCGLESRKIGGLGIHLAMKFADRLEYRRRMGKNILEIQKRIPPQPEGR